MDFSISDQETIKRLIEVSKQKPLIPETYIPWDYKDIGTEKFLPNYLISIEGTQYFDDLTAEQKIELGKHELTQVMYAYAWSEVLACAFFNNRLMKLEDHDLEYQFLTRELIEEYRHQSMFCDAIKRIGGNPKPISRFHKWLARSTVKFGSDSIVFFSVLAVELATDVYGDLLRKEEGIHPVVSKVSQLHHIEESRHIFYAQLWLKRTVDGAGLIKRSFFTTVILMNLIFMRSMYTDVKIFEEMGFSDSKKVIKVAKNSLAIKFGKYCMTDAIKYIESFNGWNRMTRFIAKKFLKAEV